MFLVYRAASSAPPIACTACALLVALRDLRGAVRCGAQVQKLPEKIEKVPHFDNPTLHTLSSWLYPAMGQAFSCSSAGSALYVAVLAGDLQAAQEVSEGARQQARRWFCPHNPHPLLLSPLWPQVLSQSASAALFSNYKDRSSPLLQASGMCSCGFGSS